MEYKRSYSCLVTALLLALPFSVFSQEHSSGDAKSNQAPDRIDTDRPDQTESAATVPKKYFQAELGFNKERYKDGTIIFTHPAGLYKYGISNRVELRLESPFITEVPLSSGAPVTGVEGVEVGAKVALCEEKGIIPKTSVIGHIGLPFLSTKEFRTKNAPAIFRITCGHTLTDFAGIGYNLGVLWDGENSPPVYLYTFSPGFTIGKHWYAYVEAFGFISKDVSPEHDLALGLAYYITNDIKIDASGGFGIGTSPLENYMALGFSFRFKALQ